MDTTLFRHLTVTFPALRQSVVSKRALIILSHLIEGLVQAAGDGATLVTGFQRQEFWELERGRYQRLAQSANVHAIFEVSTQQGDEPPWVTTVPSGDPLTEDWFLVGLSDNLAVVLCADDLRQPALRGADREFRVVVSTDAAVARAALRALDDKLNRAHPDQSAAPWPAARNQYMARPGAAALARQNDELLNGLLEQVEALRRSEQRAHRAAHRLHEQALVAADAERRRLAQTLHDESLQYLLAAHQELQEHVVRAGAGPELDRARDYLTHGVAHLRRAVSHARPEPLRPTDADLSNALEALARELHLRGDFTTTIIVPTPAHAHPRAAVLLPIARELLTNTAKHAHAKHVDIHVTQDDQNLVMTYHDDGIGFDQSRLARARADGHIGLSIIEERVTELGGTLTLTSEPGAGFDLRASIPDAHDTAGSAI